MAIVILFWQILVWHYFVAPIQFIKIWRDLMWFLYHFFSIPVLTSTLFSKWKRIGEVRHKRLDIGDFLATFFVNTVMRIVGFFIRSVTIIVGILSIVLFIGIGMVLFVAWFLYPVVVVILFVAGWKLLLGIN